jgi:hypothetical protein
MIQIVLIVLGVIAAFRLPKLIGLRPESQPSVDPTAFAAWRRVELSASVWLIVATIGVAIVQTAGGLALGIVLGLSHASKAAIESATMVFSVSTVALFLALLVVAAVRGSKARKLKLAANIRWP